MNSELKLTWTYLWRVFRNWWLILVVGVLLLSGPVERRALISPVLPPWAKWTIGVGALGLAQYLAYREQVKLKEAALASTAAKQKPKKSEASLTSLVKEGDALINRLEATQNAADVKSWLPSQLDWKERVIEALNRAKVHSEAVAFSHAADNPKESVLWTYTNIPSWKMSRWVELMLYRDNLQEIVARCKLSH